MVVLISADPRVSHRAFEAMRIATGVVAGENEVRLVLLGPAVHLLDEDTEALVDGDEVGRFRTTLRELELPFHVEAAARPGDPDWNAEGHPVIPVGREAIADLLARARRILVF